MSRPRTSSASFVDRVLDGEIRIDAFGDEIRAWQAGDQKRPLHVALGLDATELVLVAGSPDALRYILNARRFERADPQGLDTQQRVDAYSMQLAASATDPYLMAEVEGCREAIEAAVRGARDSADDSTTGRAPVHA
jgi:hypothetical protein